MSEAVKVVYNVCSRFKYNLAKGMICSPRNFQHRCFISVLCWTSMLTSSSIRATCTTATKAVASHTRLFLKSSAIKRYTIPMKPAEYAEASALCRGLQIAAENEWPKIWAEGDAKFLIQFYTINKVIMVASYGNS
ncbi:hypothetical protein LOK49_LG12G01316 [Camellia lanceoleosa]|uniref:Uncharacterized protein n=1 Tax=Camellia lanceoleosa TaxID=1840588 RepID=A0ACC0FP31_9ERIC|nr:hypothetical protein LOK49_LG12G01316 [Camellia lanceoleosa]